MIAQLMMEMIAYDREDPKRIQHFVKVHSFAKMIAELEEIGEEKRLILEAAAAVHDIGIHLCEEKYGACGGKLQEKEGPALAEQMLRTLQFDEKTIERVKFLVGHHHTYTKIDDMDDQILVEADFLVNLYEEGIEKEHAQNAMEKIFQTESGKRICAEMFGIANR